ncbi:MAG: DUF983 domain-containing protein [Caulobacteraceae bacterium]
MTVTEPTPTRKSRFLLGLQRGLRRKCPNCGEGALYSRYITVQAHCAVCGHDNAQYRADDAGPYFTILVVGHLVIGPMLFSPFIWKAPIAWVLGATLPTVAVLTLVLLPIIKGGVIGAQWALKADRDTQAAEGVEAVDAAGRASRIERI